MTKWPTEENLIQRVARWSVSALALSLLPLFASAPIARAETVTAPTTFNATNETFTAVSGSGTTPSISGFTGTVQVVITSSGGNIKVPTITGLSAPTGYRARDWNTYETATEISFTGTQTNVSNAVASLMFKATSNGTTPSISIEAFVAGVAYNSSNSHYYEVVETSTTITPELARCLAKYSNSNVTFSGDTQTTVPLRASTSILSADRCSTTDPGGLTRRTYNGLRGYLATITSLNEHNFIREKTTAQAWIGGADTDKEGTFIWLDGPEAGTVFWRAGATRRGDNVFSSQAGDPAGFVYGTAFNYFSENEPNDSSTSEDWAEFGHGSSGVGSSWNDCAGNCGRSQYIIEYGDTGDTKNSASATINVRTVPAAPTGVSATVSANRATVSFTAPSNGGSAITSYTATSSPGGLTGTVNQSGSGSITISGLVSGTAYTFTVTATNAVGTSASSAASSAATTTYSAQSVSFDSTYSEALPNSSFTVSARSSVGAAVTYRSETPEVCTIEGNKISTKSSGTCTIVASSGETIQGGVTYLAASSSISFILRSANFLRPKNFVNSAPVLSVSADKLVIKPGAFVMTRVPDESVAPKYISYTIYVAGKAELTLIYNDGIALATWQTPWHSAKQRALSSISEVSTTIEPAWKGKDLYVEEFAFHDSSVAGQRSATIRP